MIYEIIEATETEALSKLVNDKLDYGYTLQGGLSVTRLQEFILYTQAMTKPGSNIPWKRSV